MLHLLDGAIIIGFLPLSEWIVATPGVACHVLQSLVKLFYSTTLFCWYLIKKQSGFAIIGFEQQLTNINLCDTSF